MAGVKNMRELYNYTIALDDTLYTLIDTTLSTLIETEALAGINQFITHDLTSLLTGIEDLQKQRVLEKLLYELRKKGYNVTLGKDFVITIGWQFIYKPRHIRN